MDLGTIAVADFAAPVAVMGIGWMIKLAYSNRKGLEATLETNRKEAVEAVEKVNANIGLIGITVGSIKTWADFHQKQDDERHEESKRERTQLWESIERRKP